MATKFFSDKTQVSAQKPWKVHGALLSIMLLLAAMIYSIYLAVITYQQEFTDVDHEPAVYVSADDDPQPLPQQEPLPLPEQLDVDLNDRSALKFAAAETVDISQLNHSEQSTPQRVNISSISLSMSEPLSGSEETFSEQENVSKQEESVSELVDEKPDEVAPDDASIHSDAHAIEKVLQSGNASIEGIKKGRLQLIVDSGDLTLLEAILVKNYGRIIFGKGPQFDFILQGNHFDGRITTLNRQDISQLSSRQISIAGDAAQVLKKRLFETQAQAGYAPHLQFTNLFDHRLNDLHGERELTKIRVWLCGTDVCMEEVL